MITSIKIHLIKNCVMKLSSFDKDSFKKLVTYNDYQ